MYYIVQAHMIRHESSSTILHYMYYKPYLKKEYADQGVIYLSLHGELQSEINGLMQMVNQQIMLPFTLPSTEALLHDMVFDPPSSSKGVTSIACKTNRVVPGLLNSILTIKHTWLVSTSCQSALFKPETFPYCIAALE